MNTQTNGRYLSTAETVVALGVTAKALRLYEQKGLVTPLRSAAGWRAYGPEAITRLHQIIALKRLGLSLSAIGDLLSGRLAQLDAVLAVQEKALAESAAEAERALALVRSARKRLACGAALSIEDLAKLTRETTMSDQPPEWVKKMQPMIDRHFTDADKAKMKAHASSLDHSAIGAQWQAIIDEAKGLVGTDPSTPQASDLVRRWRKLVNISTGGDPDLKVRMGNVWREAMAEPNVAPSLPFGPEVFAFLVEAAKYVPAE